MAINAEAAMIYKYRETIFNKNGIVKRSERLTKRLGLLGEKLNEIKLNPDVTKQPARKLRALDLSDSAWNMALQKAFDRGMTRPYFVEAAIEEAK